MSNDDWSVQVSIKHGPADDRGNPLYLTNVRGHTARDVHSQMEDLAEWADDITRNINKFAAVGVVRQRFPDAERVDKPSPKASGARDCAHGPREYRSGAKDGKRWEGWFCPNPSKANQCAVAWVD